MELSDFNYDLPEELIAQFPPPERDQSRLLVFDRTKKTFAHHRFFQLPDFLRSGDVVVLNNTKVIPARLRAIHLGTKKPLEIFLLTQLKTNDWWALVKPGRRAGVGSEWEVLEHNGKISTVVANVEEINSEGHRRVSFRGVKNIFSILDQLGEVPLPPYIERQRSDQMSADRERYQTVFAEIPGSIAAPTAGLHFTPEIIKQCRDRSVEIIFVTLHVGLGTFAPVKSQKIENHTMHEEFFEISGDSAASLNQAKKDHRRIFAVGTSSLRVLESVACGRGEVMAGTGLTRLFVYPPYDFKIVNALLTNFHLPKSTLLMLISAFAAPGRESGREIILRAYREAVEKGYRFFSYGDAMLIL